ncbi:MAG TPA: rRNA maturation RNase YbeY [Longimicrobiales bacterium]
MRVSVEARLDRRAGIGKREASEQVRRAALATLEDQAVADAELSIALVDDAMISELNERYLGHAGPTDVISFALHEPGAPVVGDVYIGWDQALRQAQSLGIAPREELARLAIHGTLHVLGFEHPEGADRERSAMWARQEAILRRLEEDR